jgi:membrane protein involved in colicin uptake
MKGTHLLVLVAITLIAGCGPTAEEQQALVQQRCSAYGFQVGTDAFAHCMMNVSTQRESDAAADRRAAADRAAADQRARDAQQAAKDRADRDAWDKRTGQGIYSSGNPTQPTNIDTSPTAGMNCTTTTVSTGTPINQSTRSVTNCQN